MLEKLSDGISRLKIPFEDLYTSVFLLEYGEERLLLDSGSNASDVKNYLLPMLQGRGIQGIICSHLHADHCGGVQALLQAYPHTWVGGMATKTPYPKERTRLLLDGEILLNDYQIVATSGHTADCLGVLELSTKTLLSCDSLQLQGVGKYRCSVEDKNAYLATIEKIRAMGVERIIASHDYEPLGVQATGRREVEAYLNACERAIFLRQTLDKV